MCKDLVSDYKTAVVLAKKFPMTFKYDCEWSFISNLFLFNFSFASTEPFVTKTYRSAHTMSPLKFYNSMGSRLMTKCPSSSTRTQKRMLAASLPHSVTRNPHRFTGRKSWPLTKSNIFKTVARRRCGCGATKRLLTHPPCWTTSIHFYRFPSLIRNKCKPTVWPSYESLPLLYFKWLKNLIYHF